MILMISHNLLFYLSSCFICLVMAFKEMIQGEGADDTAVMIGLSLGLIVIGIIGIIQYL